MIQKITAGIVAGMAIVTLLTGGCKKGDQTAIGSGGGLISEIITPARFQPGVYDTAHITYNADSTVHQISNTGTLIVATFYYSPGLIRRVESDGIHPSGTTDSIVLGAGGLPVADYQHNDYLPDYNRDQFFSYNSNGELTQTVVVYPNIPGMTDTITHAWSGGNMVSQSDPGDKYALSYIYNTGISCRPGDALYLQSLLSAGLNVYPNAHLCTGIRLDAGEADYSYLYDTDSRITAYIHAEGGITDTTFFHYVQ